jgi:hypothetical protein
MLAGAAILLTVSAGHGHVARKSVLRGTERSPLSTRIAVLDRTVVITAPDGYCIDDTATRSDRQGALVLLASCQALSGDPGDPTPWRPGVLTASVNGHAPGSAPPSDGELSSFFASDRGLSALARSGNPDTIRVGESYARDGAYFIHAREIANSPVMGGQSWRAIFSVNGHLVTATLRELDDHPIDLREGFGIVEGFAAEILDASR